MVASPSSFPTSAVLLLVFLAYMPTCGLAIREATMEAVEGAAAGLGPEGVSASSQKDGNGSIDVSNQSGTVGLLRDAVRDVATTLDQAEGLEPTAAEPPPEVNENSSYTVTLHGGQSPGVYLYSDNSGRVEVFPVSDNDTLPNLTLRGAHVDKVGSINVGGESVPTVRRLWAKEIRQGNNHQYDVTFHGTGEGGFVASESRRWEYIVPVAGFAPALLSVSWYCTSTVFCLASTFHRPLATGRLRCCSQPSWCHALRVACVEFADAAHWQLKKARVRKRPTRRPMRCHA